MISFKNTAIAFRSKSDKELHKSHLIFHLMSRPIFHKIGIQLVKTAAFLRIPISGLLKKTLFNLFCGGESIETCTPKIEKLAQYKIKTILDYSVEGKASENDFENTTKQVIETIISAHENNQTPFAVFKISGIGRSKLLEKMREGQELNHYENLEFERIEHRMNIICKKAHELNVPIMVDAEESWIQGIIDSMVEKMMKTYNKDETIVYNTLQMYRKDRLDYLKRIYEDSEQNEYFLGFKFVRGAYMEKERLRALKMGYESPIHNTKSECDQDFNRAIEFACQKIHKISICAGTHNEESSRYLTELMNRCQIEKNSPKVHFSQLLGMSDHISYNLAEKGYNVVKYMPFGPPKEMLPYLVRRAEENKSIAGQTGRELELIREEMGRRKAMRRNYKQSQFSI